MTKLFDAISGAELLDLLMEDVRDALDGDFLFRQATVYPILRWKAHVTLEAYPAEPAVQETTASGALVSTSQKASDEGEQVEVRVGGEIEYPEETRAAIKEKKAKRASQTKATAK